MVEENIYDSDKKAKTLKGFEKDKSIIMHFPIFFKSHQDATDRVLDTHDDVMRHDVSGRTTFTLELIVVNEDGVPQIKIKHGSWCDIEDWYCDDSLLTTQECVNLKDELEKYMSQRVLIFHLE